MSFKKFDDPSPKIRNKYFHADMSYDTELNGFLLKIVGIWPLDKKNLKLFDKIFVLTVRILVSVIFVFFIVPCGCYIFLIETEKLERFRMLGPVNFVFTAFLKYLIVLARFDGIKTCIEMIVSDWREVDSIVCRSIMIKNAKACRSFAKLCIVMAFSATTANSWILPFFGQSIESSVSHNETRSRALAYPSEFYFFDYQASPMYEIIVFGHGLSMTTAATVNCGVCILAVRFVIHACNHYEIVTALIRAIDLEYDNNHMEDSGIQEKHRRTFANIIKRHLYAVEFVPHIEKVLNEICLIELFGCTTNLCLLGYYLLMEWENSEIIGLLTYIIAMISVLSNIFIYCYIGELLTEQCRKVGTACYMTNWWQAESSEARALILVIAASNFRVQLTAGKMINLSLVTFGSVLKAAMAYLNVIRTVTEDE